MKLRSITYGRGETVNMGNFNNIRFDISETADLEDGDDPHECYEKLKAKVDFNLKQAVAEGRFDR